MSMLGTYLAVEDILLGMPVSSTRQLFENVGRHMESVHGVRRESVAAALERRELARSTALGHGVAVPHARVEELDRIIIVYVRPSPALAFGAQDGQPVTDVVVLMVPAPAVQGHLDVLAQVATLFSDEGFRKALHERHDPLQVREIFERWPQ